MRGLMIVAVLAGLAATSLTAVAEEAKKDSAGLKVGVKAVQTTNITGKVSKDVVKKDKKETVTYSVETTDFGRVVLPVHARNLNAMVGKEAKLTVTFEMVKNAEGKEVFSVKKVVNWKEVKKVGDEKIGVKPKDNS